LDSVDKNFDFAVINNTKTLYRNSLIYVRPIFQMSFSVHHSNKPQIPDFNQVRDNNN